MFAVVDDFRIFQMMGMMAGFFFILVVPFVLLSFAIPYAVLRLQDSRNPDRDPQIGLKSVLYFTFSLGVLLFLSGVNVLLYDAILDHKRGFNVGPTDDWRPAQRGGAALLVSGFAISLSHLVLVLIYTNDLRRPGAARIFIGYRLAIHALANVAAFTVLMIMLFQKNPQWEDMKFPISVLLVWLPSWVAHMLLLRFSNTGGGRRSDERSRFFSEE
jgi:hypothetical protein